MNLVSLLGKVWKENSQMLVNNQLMLRFFTLFFFIMKNLRNIAYI